MLLFLTFKSSQVQVNLMSDLVHQLVKGPPAHAAFEDLVAGVNLLLDVGIDLQLVLHLLAAVLPGLRVIRGQLGSG